VPPQKKGAGGMFHERHDFQVWGGSSTSSNKTTKRHLVPKRENRARDLGEERKYLVYYDGGIQGEYVRGTAAYGIILMIMSRGRGLLLR